MAFINMLFMAAGTVSDLTFGDKGELAGGGKPMPRLILIGAIRAKIKKFYHLRRMPPFHLVPFVARWKK
jgi:hypothetical protein